MRIGRYTVTRELGRGGAGTVYAATADDGASVALKVLTGDDAAGFEREVRLHAGLDHPGVVRVLDHGTEADGTSWVAMERIDGGSLADRLAARRLAFAGTFDLDDPGASGGDEAELLGLVMDLCPALAWLHGEGLVHADLKPANILLRGSGEPVIADLGLSRAVATRSRVEDRIRGSLGYVSPEQARGEPLDARADLFSLGAILFEVLTGGPPTDPANPREALRRLTQPAEPPSSRVQGVDPRLDQLVLSLLDRDRTRRPPGATWVAHVLGQVLGRPVQPHRRVRAALFVAPLVGRDEELQRALAATRAALRQGGLVVLRGDGGLGTTRLASEVTTALRADGAAVAGARGRPGGPPLATVRTLSERVAEVTRVDDPVRAWREAPSPTADLAGLGHQLADQWRRASAKRPVLLVIDEVDQCGSESIEVLGHALGELTVEPTRVALLATAHEGAAPHVEALLGTGTTVVLGPMSAPDLLRVAAGALGVERLPLALEHVLPERTGGSPLLACEWVTTAVAEGAIRPGDGGWAPATDPGTPGTLDGLIDARLDHLLDAQIEVIAAAGWLDDHLTEDRLARIDEVGGVRAGLAYRLLERDVDGLSLVHPAVASRAAARLSVERASAIRRSLAARFGDEVSATSVARWLDAAGDVEGAARAWGRVAEETSRHHPTVTLQALVRVAELRGDARSWWEVGQQAMHLGVDELVIRAAPRLEGIDEWRAEAALLRCAMHRAAGRLEEAAQDARLVRQLTTDPSLLRMARHLHISALNRADVPPAALRAAFGEAQGDPVIRSILAWCEERWEDAAAAFADEERDALARGDTTAAVRASGNVGVALHRAGRPVEAQASTVTTLLLARRAGLRETEAHVWMTLALGYQGCGRSELALRSAGASLAVAIGMGRADLVRRALELFAETGMDDRAWKAAELVVRLGAARDPRLWVAARLGAPERVRELVAAPPTPANDTTHAAWTSSSLDELRSRLAETGPEPTARALDTWFHRTGRDREAAIESWRRLVGTPGAGMALARLGLPPPYTLPDPPVAVGGAMPDDPGALVDLAVRRFSGS
ncbi:MAG: protein kinase [Alphaproteobacteria bacterium]|nr:protein kinase [Alphaproteobacteria bacterium]